MWHSYRAQWNGDEYITPPPDSLHIRPYRPPRGRLRGNRAGSLRRNVAAAERDAIMFVTTDVNGSTHRSGSR